MKVNEIFGPTIQGEGRSAGMPTMFLRTSGCNLACSWCDTPYTWNWIGTKFTHPEKYDRKEEIHNMSCGQIITELKKMGPKVKALVITGGEPMLQQDELIELIKLLKKESYWVEIETNGTVQPNDAFLGLINQINCSPKTGNSGADNKKMVMERSVALKKLASSEKTFFKFVIQGRNDLPEIMDLISRYNMENVYLMAESRTREDQDRLNAEVNKICLENNFNFSPRLHILIWNRERGH